MVAQTWLCVWTGKKSNQFILSPQSRFFHVFLQRWVADLQSGLLLLAVVQQLPRLIQLRLIHRLDRGRLLPPICFQLFQFVRQLPVLRFQEPHLLDVAGEPLVQVLHIPLFLLPGNFHRIHPRAGHVRVGPRRQHHTHSTPVRHGTICRVGPRAPSTSSKGRSLDDQIPRRHHRTIDTLSRPRTLSVRVSCVPGVVPSTFRRRGPFLRCVLSRVRHFASSLCNLFTILYNAVLSRLQSTGTERLWSVGLLGPMVSCWIDAKSLCSVQCKPVQISWHCARRLRLLYALHKKQTSFRDARPMMSEKIDWRLWSTFFNTHLSIPAL